MKKILFGSAAAICAVAGFSSFKSIHRFAGPYYFQVKNGINVPVGSSTAITPAQVTHLSSNTGCPVSGSGYECIVTFTQHVNAAGTKLTQAAIPSSTLSSRLSN